MKESILSIELKVFSYLFEDINLDKNKCMHPVQVFVDEAYCIMSLLKQAFSLLKVMVVFSEGA